VIHLNIIFEGNGRLAHLPAFIVILTEETADDQRIIEGIVVISPFKSRFKKASFANRNS